MGLRELRKRSNITLEQLSALTGYDMPRLSRYETVDDDARNMFLGTAASLARILHCNVLDLYPDEHVWRGGVSAGVRTHNQGHIHETSRIVPQSQSASDQKALQK